MPSVVYHCQKQLELPKSIALPYANTTSVFKVKKKQLWLCGLSLRANYTDRATTACPRIYCQLLQIEGVT
jgi:hypothetical protein